MDQKLIEMRLMTKDSAFLKSDPSIGHCAEKLHPLRNGGSNAALESFFRELLLFKLDLEKSYMILEVKKKQNNEYEGLEKKIEEDIANAKSNVVRLEEQFQQEKQIRKHRLEAEALAKDVNTYPTRGILKRNIEALELTRKENNDSLATIEGEISKRKKMFASLNQIISDLQLTYQAEQVEEEEEEEEDEEERQDVRERDSQHAKESKIEVVEEGDEGEDGADGADMETGGAEVVEEEEGGGGEGGGGGEEGGEGEGGGGGEGEGEGEGEGGE